MIKFTVLSLILSSTLIAQPISTSWFTELSGQYARAYPTTTEETANKESDRYKFSTPSLRNVSLTAPYMHDGRFATLEEVIDHYNAPATRNPTLDPNLAKHPQGLGLNEDDKTALIAFLKTLTDRSK